MFINYLTGYGSKYQIYKTVIIILLHWPYYFIILTNFVTMTQQIWLFGLWRHFTVGRYFILTIDTVKANQKECNKVSAVENKTRHSEMGGYRYMVKV